MCLQIRKGRQCLSTFSKPCMCNSFVWRHQRVSHEPHHSKISRLFRSRQASSSQLPHLACIFSPSQLWQRPSILTTSANTLIMTSLHIGLHAGSYVGLYVRSFFTSTLIGIISGSVLFQHSRMSLQHNALASMRCSVR